MNIHKSTFPTIIILDPESAFVIKWKRLMVIIGVLSVIFDPFFLYIPRYFSKGPTCVGLDVQAAIFFTSLRTFLDIFHFFNMILQFRIALQGPGPKTFKGTANLIKDPRLIATKYLKSRFTVNLLAILPFPQMVLWTTSSTDLTRMLSTIVMIQFAPRMMIMVPLLSKIIEAFGIVAKNVWSGVIYNLFIFILIGHFIGAIYYQNYMANLDQCVSEMSNNETDEITPFELDCSQAHKQCRAQHKEFDHGMFADAFANEIGSRNSIQKVIYCFVWGVRSLSSLGQIFDVSSDVMETTFSCMVMIIGLIWLSDLIARMQTSVRSAGSRGELQRLKQRKLEEWTHYHDLPPNLKEHVRQSIQLEWRGTKGIDDEAILSTLPLDLRSDIRNHLYKERVRDMPPFMRMDEQLLDFVCGHLRGFTGAEGTYIVLQGDPLEQVVFVFSGLLQLTHRTAGCSNSRNLEAGEFFGDDLLTWASQPNSSTKNLPPSKFSVKCISNVEAFCLPAQDVRHLVIFNYSQKFHLALRDHHA